MQRNAGFLQNKIRLVIAASLIAGLLPQLSDTALASSPQFGATIVRLANLDATNATTTQYSGGTVCITTPASGVGTENYVDIGFPDESGVATATDDFQVSTTLTNWITSTTPPASPGTGSNYWPAGAVAWPSIGATAVAATDGSFTTGNATTLKAVRFATGALAASTTYCFDFKDGSGTPGAETSSTYSLQNSYVGTNGYQEDEPGYVATYSCSTGCTTVGAGTQLMASNWATQMVANDQIVVSAVVPPIFEFSLSANTDTVPASGNLDINSVNVSGGVTATATTNAKGGWIMWSEDKNQALDSASSGGSIPTVAWNSDAPSTLAPNVTAAYALNVTKVVATGTTSCTVGVAPEYDTATSGGDGGAFTANFVQIGQCTGGPSGGDGLKLQEEVAINALTPAATDYTDTLTVVGAGSF